MSNAGIIYDPQRPQTSVEGIASLEFDAILDEQAEWSNEVTSNPVEKGAPVSDHIIQMADKFRLTAMISDSSIYGAATEGQSLTQMAHDTLRELYEKREVVTLYTKYRVYEDMAISYVGIPRVASGGNALIFPMEFTQIRITETQTTKVPPGISKKLDKKSTESVKKKAEPQKAAGAKQPVPVKVEEKSGSVLSGLFGK
jgi:hypothetical protein